MIKVKNTQRLKVEMEKGNVILYLLKVMKFWMHYLNKKLI